METIVIIGVPVFDGGVYIKRALESIRSQTLKNFTVIISDNASTDDTGKICQSLSEVDGRFVYKKQDVNIGALGNFQSLLTYANAEYFVFLAADDYWEPTFLERNISRLEIEKSSIASISRVDFRKDDEFILNSNGDYEISGTITERLQKYFSFCSDNSRFYAVYRRAVIQEALRDPPNCHAADWYISALTLMKGEHLCVDEILMHREIAEADRYSRSVKADNSKYLIGEYFPVLPLTFAIFHRLPFAVFLKILGSMLRLNRDKHVEYVIFKHGASFYTRLLARL